MDLVHDIADRVRDTNHTWTSSNEPNAQMDKCPDHSVSCTWTIKQAEAPSQVRSSQLLQQRELILSSLSREAA